jgi:hypothetical protein
MPMRGASESKHLCYIQHNINRNPSAALLSMRIRATSLGVPDNSLGAHLAGLDYAPSNLPSKQADMIMEEVRQRVRQAGPWGRNGSFVLELRALWIGIEIEIVIEIDYWQFSDFDSDFDFDELCPTLGVPCEQPPTYRSEIMNIFQRTKWP